MLHFQSSFYCASLFHIWCMYICYQLFWFDEMYWVIPIMMIYMYIKFSSFTLYHIWSSITSISDAQGEGYLPPQNPDAASLFCYTCLFCFCTGDPRRPYPTDFEMRLGFLGKVGDLPLNTPVLQSQGSYGEPMSSNRSTAQTGKVCRQQLLSVSNKYLKKMVAIS